MTFDVSALPPRYQQQIREGLGKKKSPVVEAVTSPPEEKKKKREPHPVLELDTSPLRALRVDEALVVWVEMMGKPRMTQQDKWLSPARPRVQRYRNLEDRLIPAVPREMTANAIGFSWVCYLPMPDTWPKWKKQRFSGKLHQDKPDRDNIEKALADILFKEDKSLAVGSSVKYWDDGLGPRIILKFHYEHPDYAGEYPADSRRGTKGR